MRTDYELWDTDEEPRSMRGKGEWQLIKAMCSRPLTFIIVSRHYHQTMLHHFGGRDVPHLKSGCVPCKVMREKRWTGHFLAIGAVDEKKYIVQYPEGPAQVLKDEQEKRGDIRGCKLILTRVGKRNNGPVKIELLDGRYTGIKLPEEVDMAPILSAIWDVRITGNGADRALADLTDEQIKAAELSLLQACSGHDDEWIQAKIKDIPGQRRMFTDGINHVADRVNGHSTANPTQ